MAVFLAYIEPVPDRLYPLVATFQELARRGHRVAVRTGISEVRLLRSIGIDAEPLAPEIIEFVPTDWQARTRLGALASALARFGERARFQPADLERAIASERPDVLMVDETSWGAAAAAERSRLPWAFCLASPPPFSSRDAPPFGLGLPPRHDLLGRLRDRVARRVVEGALVHIIASHANPLRAELGLRPVRSMSDIYMAAPLVLVYTAEPFEYPRRDWPEHVRLVGPGLWEPPAETPRWLDGLTRPIVLVTCSTAFQNDRRLAEVACDAFAGEPLDVVVTTAGADPAGLRPPPNVRVERFLPHSPMLEPHASSATAGWASPSGRSPMGCQLSPSRSAAISRRSPAVSRWPAPVCASRRAGSPQSGCETPCARPWRSGPGPLVSRTRLPLRGMAPPPPRAPWNRCSPAELGAPRGTRARSARSTLPVPRGARRTHPRS